MAFDLTGRRSATLAALLIVSAGLSACTTTEGTNAFASPQTFETEVMDSTAQGLGLIPAPVKPDPTNPRGPLVMPKSTTDLPAPTKDTTTAMLPADSDKVSVDTAQLSQADIERLRKVRVVSTETPDGRPLTAAELKQMTGRLKSFQISKKHSLFTPPEQYFSVTNGQPDLVCLSNAGVLVPVNDPTCPPEIRQALLKKG